MEPGRSLGLACGVVTQRAVGSPCRSFVSIQGIKSHLRLNEASRLSHQGESKHSLNEGGGFTAKCWIKMKCENRC